MLQQYPAKFFDGHQAMAFDVFVQIDRAGGVLCILDTDGQVIDTWPIQNLRKIGDVADGKLHLRLQGHDHGARLIVANRQAMVAINALGTRLASSDMNAGHWRKIGYWFGGATAALLLMIFVIVPALAGTLARMIPVEREVAIGEGALRQIEYVFSDTEKGGWVCDGAKGAAALEKMVTAVVHDYQMPMQVTVQVVDHPMVNAFALPGGQVVLMQGLLDTASSPDQVAGVLAHELGHVAHRDPMEQALRAAGTTGLLSLMIGDFSGGAVIALGGEHIINSAYSRGAETRADEFALDMLQNADIDAQGFADFFALMQDEMGITTEDEERFAFLSTHPVTEHRMEMARAAVVEGQSFAPVLTDDEWADLRAICE
ncbi:MAG: M48 family metallopeptidase [Planktomarina sp.]